MAAVVDARTVTPGFGNALELVRVEYDFAKDGGATGALDLLTATSAMVVVAAWLTVKTTCTSGGSATVKVGVTGDDDRFVNTTQGAVANLTALATIIPPALEGTPNVIATPVALAAGEKVLMTIGTAALTAGKFEVVLVLAKP